MKNFKFVNNVAGWITFAIAALVYLLTIEPTASFWDCPEFIAISDKMEVGHPPGNSIFMLIARFFVMFVPVSAKAMMVNIMSALCTAFCILFLFWSITHLARKIYTKDGNELSSKSIIAIIGAGFVGALAYTFSDTLWFSAVEGEVYAMSSLFTALVFWLILKWEDEADQKYANRWLILLAYLMGISIGVHQLNLLAIPAIMFIYYYKKYDVTKKGILKTLLFSAVILLICVFALIPGIPQLGEPFELIFVNVFGLSYNSGLAFYAFFILALLSLAIYYTYKPQKKIANIIITLCVILGIVLIYALAESVLPVMSTLLFIAVGGAMFWAAKKYRVLVNTTLLCLTMFIVGYFSLATIVIRSEANTPINENAPDNVFSLLSYINREQYGNRPLFTGPSFVSRPIAVDYKTTFYKDPKAEVDKDLYIKAEAFNGYEYQSKDEMFLSRLYSITPSHIEEYAQWTGMRLPRGQNGRYAYDPNWKGPSMLDNVKFMVNYQFNWMYWRYFMWNYVGRQNDVQGHGDSFKGNWITGITPLDDARLGIKSADMPDYLKENKGNNRYFLLPLILGILGLLFQWVKDRRNFTVVFFLFIMTGFAIAFYLNMPPLQPRERDYVFAGSTYAFAIWIGFGVLAVYEFFNRYIKKSVVSPVAAIAVCMAVPVIMGSQNWDDHDRSNRYVARDFAHNYLSSCGENAILVTFGDNDTFPIWYMQETEEERTDVRVVNTSLLGGDWYIDQMKCKVYDSDPVPFSLPKQLYLSGVNEQVDIVERVNNKPITAKQVIAYINNPKNQINGEVHIPGRNIIIPVDKQAVLRNGIVAPKDAHLIVDTIYLTLDAGKQTINKPEMMLIDMFANYKWDRPVYFTSVNGNEIEIGHKDYLQFDGFVYKFVPIRTEVGNYSYGRVDTDVLYDNLMEKYKWGNMDEPNVLVDYHIMVPATIIVNVREHFARLALALADEEKYEKAIEVLDRAMVVMPRKPFFYNVSVPQHELAVMDMIHGYYLSNAPEKANALFDEFFEETSKCLRFFVNLRDDGLREIQLNIEYLRQLTRLAVQFGEKERAEKVNNLVNGQIAKINVRRK